MIKCIALFTVLTAVAVSSIPLELKSITGWNELVYGEGVFEDNLNTIKGKSNLDEVILQELRDLLNQDEHMKSIYIKYTAIFKTPQNADDAAPHFRTNKLKEQLLKIAAHNLDVQAGKHFWWMGLNQFSDLTQDELEMFLSPNSILSNLTRSHSPNPAYKPLSTGQTAPAYLNYVEKGIVSRVKDQGRCTSCTMFAAVAVLESADAIKNNRSSPLELSEQELVECVNPDWSCKLFANILDSFDYIKKNGISLASGYPYTSGGGVTTGECKASKDSARAQLAIFGILQKVAEDTVPQLLVDHGPVVVFFFATQHINSYKSGVYSGDSECNGKRKGVANHAALLVGYGATKHGEDYWLIKNSWGARWGESGYLRLLRNGQNVCSFGAQIN